MTLAETINGMTVRVAFQRDGSLMVTAYDGALRQLATCTTPSAEAWDEKRLEKTLRSLLGTILVDTIVMGVSGRRPQEVLVMVPWPADQPQRFNACTEPCDMWTGPCCCGATHKDGV